MSESPEALALATAARLAHALGPRRRPTTDDLRRLGWAVAVHNDYRLNGEHHTFWLWTKDGRAVKGEGRTDEEALAQVGEQVQAEVASGGDPERGPALSGRSGRVEWSVKVSGGGDTGLRVMIVVRIRVGSAAYVRFGNETWVPEGRAPLADWRECVRLAEAADGGAK